MRIFILIIMLLSQVAEANVALNQLDTLLQKKVSPKGKEGITQTKEIEDFAKNYYFVFIYRSTCSHCHKFAPVLKDFAENFHFKVKAYSLDNQSLEGFKAEPLTPELFQTFYVNGDYKPAVPALYLINRHTLEGYAVLFGEATPYQLANRVNTLKQHIEERFRD